MDNIITANELKTKGVSILDNMTSNGKEAIISVHGKQKYIVLTIQEYNHLRECELEAAIIESKRDLEDGKIINESIDEHLKRITSV